MVSVQVFWKSTGKPADGKKVCLKLSGGFSKDEYTNKNGEVHFDNKPGQGKVSVGGNYVYDGILEGRVVVYI